MKAKRNAKEYTDSFDQYVDEMGEQGDAPILVGERLRAEVWRDASLMVEEVLSAVRTDLENASLNDAADTAARMVLEMVARLWFERKQEVAP